MSTDSEIGRKCQDLTFPLVAPICGRRWPWPNPVVKHPSGRCGGDTSTLGLRPLHTSGSGGAAVAVVAAGSRRLVGSWERQKVFPSPLPALLPESRYLLIESVVAA